MEDKNTFMDSRTIIAIILVAVVFFGWQSYISKKYPNLNQTQTASSTTVPNQTLNTTAPAPQTKTDGQTPVAAPSSAEVLTHFSGSNLSLDISSRGMQIKNVTFKNFLDRADKNVVLAGMEGAGFFGTSILGSDQFIDFKVTQNADGAFVGSGATADGMTVTKTLEIQSDNYVINVKHEIENLPAKGPGVSLHMTEKRAEFNSGSLIAPPIDSQEVVVKAQGKENRILISASKDPVQQDFQSVSIAAIGTHNFTSGILDQSEVIPSLRLTVTSGDQAAAHARMDFELPGNKGKVELKQTGYFGPKSLTLLQAANKEFEALIDYGMFASIARILLGIMKWFYSWVGNWGFAIILLTLLVRLVVLPFNIASYRSMKKMQKIQPLMQSLRERYKDDPATLNRETMSLMKEHGANPLGGCLPMLLQMPIFFALYQVFGQGVELYRAPFIFWIKDLSLKDPFFILPILMVVAMYFQQKLTPTTMDPAQAKIMQWMPVVFGFMMLALPSGLTLYIFVSTLFGLIQQQVFIKDRGTSIVAKAAKA